MIYGAGGGIGGAVARAFAREGARVFLAGRRRAPVEAVANDIPLVERSSSSPLPITTYVTSYFLAARLAARRMVGTDPG